MKNLIRKILKEENGLGWMDEVPSDINLTLYKFLEDNFSVVATDFTGTFSGEEFKIKNLIGMGESFSMSFLSKKMIYNKIYWLVEDNFNYLDEALIRRTIRKFLNDKYKE
jgi:hypothetical protein